jgi:two-component system, NtrC family, sensor kinase
MHHTLTDLNELAEEYLKLGYYGFRSKNKSLNYSFQTVYDGSIGRINLIPQDIGQILVNLFRRGICCLYH